MTDIKGRLASVLGLTCNQQRREVDHVDHTDDLGTPRGSDE
jgi:hypothetical protein